jgi:hypothetical protein
MEQNKLYISFTNLQKDNTEIIKLTLGGIIIVNIIPPSRYKISFLPARTGSVCGLFGIE